MAKFNQIFGTLIGLFLMLMINGIVGSPSSDKDVTQTREKRNTVLEDHELWTNGVVPYFIMPGFTQEGQRVIYEAMNEFHQVSCLKFVPYIRVQPSPRDVLVIQPSAKNCASYGVGRMGGQQILELASTCLEKYIIIHELMHAIGFYHEQSRGDRDNYIQIVQENFDPKGWKFNFEKIPGRTWGFEYDYCSIMHYYENIFSTNGGDTIAYKKPPRCLGERKKLTHQDIMKINYLYQCKRRPTVQ